MRRTISFSLLLIAGACAPPRGPGALSPVTARVTNAAVSADLVTLDGWRRRVAALGETSAAAKTPERAYAVASAEAWIDYARESYVANPRDVVADSALERARRIALALEANEPAPATGEWTSTVAVRADLRAALDSLRPTVRGSERVAGLADAELALVRADRLAGMRAPGAPTIDGAREAAERNCRLQAEIIRASRLVDWLRGAPAMTVAAAAPVPVAPATAPVVREEPGPTAPVSTSVPASAAEPAPAAAAGPSQVIAAALDAPASEAPTGAQPVRRTVHFAVASATLSPASRRILDGVVEIMRKKPGVGVALAGYTDWRAGTLYNRALARRRAVAVRDYLERSGAEMGQVTIVAAGTDSASRGHVDVHDYARDRRVELVLLDANGWPFTADKLAAAEHEHDLQVESEAQAKRLARMRWKPVPRVSSGLQR